MKALVPDLLLVLGAVLVPLGVAAVYWPAAVAVLGLECLGFGYLAARATGRG